MTRFHFPMTNFNFFFQSQCPAAPVIEQFHFPRHLQLGMRARLVCTVISGDPPFNIRWLHNETAIWTGSWFGDSKSKMVGQGQVRLTGVAGKVDEFSSDLSFQSVSVEHNGNYTCEVHNELASAQHTAQLIVEGMEGTEEAMMEMQIQ